MKSSLVVVLLVIVVAAGVMTPGTLFADPANSVNVGIGGVVQTMPHCDATVYILEYEHLLDSKLAFLGRSSQVHYRFDNSEYIEDGRQKGVDLGARYYPAGGMQGFFIGGTLGYWMADWSFSNDFGNLQGKGETNSIRANLDLGARFPIGSSKVSVMPALNIGKFFYSTTCDYTAPASQVGTTCSQQSEVNYYMFLAVTVGTVF